MIIPNKNALILNATAGHGKDYVLSSLPEILQRDIVPISFSKPIKMVIAKNLPNKIKDMFPYKEDIEILNTLKDERHDVNVFGNMNMRKFLQVFLGNKVLRGINQDINLLLTAQSMKESIQNKDNFVFVCSDNRYANEQEFLLKYNQVDKDSKIEFLDNYMFNNKTQYNDFEIIEKIGLQLGSEILTAQDSHYLHTLTTDFLKAHMPLTKVQQTAQDYSNTLKDFDYTTIGKMNRQEGIQLGVINIFRPLISDTFKVNATVNDIKQEAMRFNSLSLNEVNAIEDNYNRYGVEFNYDNVKQYSFLRADPTHASERQLDCRKPEAFINNPKDSGLISIEEQLKSVVKVDNPVIKKSSKYQI